MSAGGWLEIDVERSGAELRARALGSRQEQPGVHPLGPELTADSLQTLGGRVKAAAESGRRLDPQLARQVQALHGALFQGDIQGVLARLREASAGGPVLLRLMLQETGLQGFPWEALCEPGKDFEFLGNSASVLPVRGVRSPEPWQTREVSGAVRLLAVAPLHPHALSQLQGSLHESLAAGEIEWLEPLTGPHARRAPLFERLRRQPEPHILHLISHAGLHEGWPVLRLADEEGEESWLPVELLAQQLHRAWSKGPLRLIVLDACEGASPGTLVSAAEVLARTAADAVVAYLWPVRTDVAMRCSRAFYRALTRASQQEGNVALSLNEARRSVLAELEGSAEAFSPVLYLRGRDPVLFDFKARRILPPAPPATRPGTSSPPPALVNLLARPFTLLLGDRWEEEEPTLRHLHERLHSELTQKMGAVPPTLSLITLAEHFALRIGEEALDYEFQDVFGQTDFVPPLVHPLARWLGAGVHITLLRLPLLEQAIAALHPELTVHVIQPSGRVDGHALMMQRRAGGSRWERLREPPASLDTGREVVVLRLCSGYLPPHHFSRPLLTEDDYLLGIRGLASLLPSVLADPIQSVLSLRPLLCIGLSQLNWCHRMLLYQLFGGRALMRDSVAVLEPRAHEREVWEEGRGLPGHTGVRAFEAADEELRAWLEALAAGRREGGNQ
ncbi:MAG TPA: CHAT domain-containing protein [Archangium sp.]|uniref:CHAT domain-containing protein n=1 Tax=Archangium sp. TaxID=1872627 RepID=UPI002E30CB57|nr:CHAT domain-containing protein [Archangium sp.]HEX5752252.1 CHAT domain-containing protein [Archangium sp.]